MIPKVIGPASFDFNTAQVSVLPAHSRGIDEHYYRKVAKEVGGTMFEKEIKELKPIPGHTVIHVLAVGDMEWYGDNRNNDGFPEEDNKRCHRRFKTDGHVFKDHDSEDPANKTGDVIVTGHNNGMHRIELLAALENSKNEDEVEALENGEDVPVSMGTLQPYDVCSFCGHKAPTAEDYCDHIKYMLGEVMSDGTKVFMINPDPHYMDLSTVWKPADRIGYTLRKVALEGSHTPGYKVAQQVGMSKLASEKRAMMRRLAVIEKRLEGMAQLPSTAPESLDDVALKKLKSAAAAHSPGVILGRLHSAGEVLDIGDFADVILRRPGLRKEAEAAKRHLWLGFNSLLSGDIELGSMDGEVSSTPVTLDDGLVYGLSKTASMRSEMSSRRSIRHSLGAGFITKVAAPQNHLPDPTAARGLAELYLHYKVGFACHPKNRSDEATLRALVLSNVLPG